MKNILISVKQLLVISSSLLILISCSIHKQISKSAREFVLSDPSLAPAHVGISIYEPARKKYWYNYQGGRYFVPASNTKIPTCYAAMKYLGDSLVGIVKIENDTALLFLPAADPTLLHPEFRNQPVISFLQNATKKIYTTDIFWKEESWGSGWSWNDYNEPYMAERSPMPVYGNLVKWVQENMDNEPAVIYSIPEVGWMVNFDTAGAREFSVTRHIGENDYKIAEGKEKLKEQNVPFVTNGIKTTLELLSDTLHKTINLASPAIFHDLFFHRPQESAFIHTQPTDSLLKSMMHRSDNFFAEQSLLMISNKLLGAMNDEGIIDTLLKNDFKDVPQTPRWVDGSGLSRYNLFTPRDLVSILTKMKNDFGMERIKTIFPTGNEGTLTNYYVAEHGYIFAKTGTLSGVVCLSGFLYTKKNRLLIFSVLVNNHQASSTSVRRAVEKFVKEIRKRL